ncbi:hypothetical protein CGCF415_v012995 [Colletotrichum fructicola]|nr:hypothetical protein CGCF415_v012995 [Colletotrichum fructicola]KAF4930065.1 hypothetical protein CGCF245_v011898 [Colletotrichum fructicola]KAF5484292.1 hypothetical protein CGCF413_v015220 [Colletotrichum fructicola]
MAGEDVSVAIAALVIAIVALFAATLQFAQAVFATARGLPNCDERVMGKWSKNSKSKFRWRQLRLEIEFEAPIIFLAPPGNERNPGEGAAWHAEGTIDSCKQTRVDYDKLSPKNDLESVHTVNNELATWVYLLNAIERMEKDSRDWEAEERDKESGQKFMPVGTKPPPVTLTVKIMAKKRSFDTNPAIKKPYAITTISHLVELASVLGIYWKVFDRDDNKYRAEGNGYILTGSRIADFGIVFVFEKTGRTTFGERRLIPTSEVKELCFGRVPTLFRAKKDEAEDVEWQDPLKTSSGKDNVKVEILELGSESEIAETLTQIGCNVETILYYKDKKKHRHIFPVTFELVGMTARVLHIKGRCFRFLPNPTIFPWDRESVSLVRLLSAFSELIGRDLDSIQDTISLMTEDNEQPDDMIQQEVKQIRSMLEEAESLKQDFRTDAALSHTRMTKLHETIEFLDELIDKRNQAIVLDVLRRHLQVVLKAINGPGQEKNAKDGQGANGSKPASDDISFGDLLGVPLEMREQRFMEIYFDQILWRVIGSTNVSSTTGGDEEEVTREIHSISKLRRRSPVRAENGDNDADVSPMPSPRIQVHQPTFPTAKHQNGLPSPGLVHRKTWSSRGIVVQRDWGNTVKMQIEMQRLTVWYTLVFRMICWLTLHDFDKKDVQVSKSELIGNRQPVFIM